MRPASTPFRTARLICVALVATLCVVAAPGAHVRNAKAAGIGTIDYFPTTTTSNYFTSPENNIFENTGDFTFEAWIKPDATCIAASAYACMFANKPIWSHSPASARRPFALCCVEKA